MRANEAGGMSIGVLWNAGVMSSVRSDWATPRVLFEMLNREFQFALDVCATPETALCPRWFHRSEDALRQDWDAIAIGRSIWMNPPYGSGIADWIEKATRESKRSTVVCLLPARTDTSWFHDYCLKGEIRFLRGRLCFDDNRKKRGPIPLL